MTHLMNAWTQRVRFLTVVTFISILLLALAAERADAVYYGLPTVTAFQANTHELLTYVSPEYSGGEKGVLYGSKAGIAEGTSPSVTGFGGYGYTVAFHAYGSAALWIYQSQYGTASPTGWGMETGTSPSITSVTGGSGEHNFEVAFRASGSGDLWTYDSCLEGCTSLGRETHLGIAAGTNPSISHEIEAFQAAGSHRLWIYWPNIGTWKETPYQIATGTSPSIVGFGPSSYEVAFQSPTGALSTYSSSGAEHESSWGVAPGTSPSIGMAPGGSWKIAFQGSGGTGLWTSAASGETIQQELGMAAGTSPSITERCGGATQTEVAFQANTTSLWWDANGVGTSLGLGMEPGTSPSIAGMEC
jgi:hypothetical protein